MVLRRKCIAINAYIMKVDYQIKKLTFHLKRIGRENKKKSFA